ncbi:MAG: tRNA (adenosine(37)-N6)-threonylcarbamoyltransferase complex dimerization subunit type 1 TsaB [Chloroflexales bacterium]|nr:tRNA (adenosine(37)-N6)-threonylcarbamoyltransferase complex dimerization subunit type 1 TsaB [Chloroflexales bacterium]
MLLAIDTSTKLIGLALYDEGGPLAECAWNSGNQQGAQLLPQLDLLMAHVGCGRESIAAVGVALGPGSWSGLRVGMSVAKGIALAGGLPIIGVGTLDALAYQHKRPATPVFPLIALGRERYATAEYQHRGQWKRLGEPRNVLLDELATTIGDRALFCGDIGPAVQQLLRGLLGERALFASPAANLRRPGYLAALAWQRLHDGSADNVDTLEPIYLGDAVQGR